jgi:type IX secretion system PorP/SprF family membrane protein
MESRNAVGGLVFADNNGPYQSVGVKLDYAHIVPFNKKRTTLSLGLGGMLFSKRLRLDKYDASDPLIAANMGSKIMVPDFNAGVLLTHRQLYAGFSVSQLMENSFQPSKLNYTTAQTYRNFYLMTGYRFVYDIFEIEPSVAAGYNFAPESYHNNGKFVDVNIECFLKPVVFTLSYRIDGYITTSLLYRSPTLELGIRTELLSTNVSDARFVGIGLMASYTFLSDVKR